MSLLHLGRRTFSIAAAVARAIDGELTERANAKTDCCLSQHSLVFRQAGGHVDVARCAVTPRQLLKFLTA